MATDRQDLYTARDVAAGATPVQIDLAQQYLNYTAKAYPQPFFKK
jgi:hypothetical protein